MYRPVGVVVKGRWVPGDGCAVTSTNHRILSIMFLYSVCFDFIVLALSAWKLYDPQWKDHSQIAKILFKDGLSYFAVAFSFNLLAATFMLLYLNVIMSAMFGTPAAVASTIVALRSVRRLFKLKDRKPAEVVQAARISTILVHQDYTGHAETNGSIVFAGRANNASVHVQIAADPSEVEYEEDARRNKKLRAMGLYP
ncbi:hypothetical protein EUX98_g8630 [Antrodiella citrinella]|uniref:Uncharacterized protein n=1 Tax=Antrodiella citrinella TaxID=2447956 RepID=A0A4S4M4V2_9APHY|nr:hypothetical protein EUX98_g8630 [Antrodiella citrinella]